MMVTVNSPLRWMGMILIAALGLDGARLHAETNAAADALLAVAEIERFLLNEDRSRYAAMALRRAEILGDIEVLHDALEAAVREVESPDSRRVIELVSQLDRAEADRAALLVAERLLLDRISEHLQRMEQFEQRLDSLEARDENAGALAGTWDLVLMPSGQRGTATLQQAGALVSGTYRLEGDWSGSLQGTLVNRKVFLVRIDSKLGKSMELEGYLSSDGKQIRGSWLNYELAGGEGATGQWSARRRANSD